MATPEHCLVCFESLAATLENRQPLTLIEVQSSYAEFLDHLKTTTTQQHPALARAASSSSSSLSSTASDKVTDPNARYPLFVTWDQQQPRDADEWHLRGCIGTFSSAERLSKCLPDYATISALHDDRFMPVERAELPSLRCAVTLLTNFEECEDIDDWAVGEHGIKIRFRVAGVEYSGTYLPSVAPEQGWGKDDTMYSLMRKAGWRGSRGKWREVAEASGMQVVRYRGDKEELDYAEFKEWRDWVNVKGI